MKYKKIKAFTFAEVLILLLTLSILMAATAPMMTKRQNTVGTDYVWTYVSSDDSYDAYFDSTQKSNTAQAFIGVPAKTQMDIASASQNDNGATLYSKLVLRASAALSSGKKQRQIQFRYGNTANGTLLGTLFAGNSNFLLGGLYKDISTGSNNTAYGYQALTNLTTGYSNTAVGYNALSGLSTGFNNTAIGHYAGSKITSSEYNTLIGNFVANNGKLGNYNTLIGHYSASQKDLKNASYNTALGNNALEALTTGYHNTAVGEKALNLQTTGYYNTAIGYNTLSNTTTGYYNTAIGYNAGAAITEGSYKTFIGANSGTFNDDDYVHEGLFTGDHERVFIGSLPKDTVGRKNRPAAVLEVHNIDAADKNGRLLPISGYSSSPVGYASVVINGNLVVRGQTYLESSILRQANGDIGDVRKRPKGLVAYTLSRAGNNKYIFAGLDGTRRTDASYQKCDKGNCKQHAYNDMRKNCICTTGGSYGNNGSVAYTNYAYNEAVNSFKGVSTSYDWTSNTVDQISVGDDGDWDGTICTNANPMGQYYYDRSVGAKFILERNAEKKYINTRFPQELYNKDRTYAGNLGTDYPLAHLRPDNETSNFGAIYTSCCPNLTSDIRLKNVGEKFSAGLDELKKINIYNYTFKNDKNKTPHVGVIAQDLKRIFPNAVTKGDDGYYHIRWDEMLYAVINSVKDLNSRVEKLANKISDERAKISNLQKDNAELNAKLDDLELEIEKLESRK